MFVPIHRIGIVAHTDRLTQAEQLADSVGAEFISMDDGTIGAGHNHIRVWQHLGTLDTEWAVVLEDDCLPVDGFTTQLDQALEVAPAPIVSCYLGRSRPPQWQTRIREVLDKADANQACWIAATQLFHHVAVAIRTDLIDDMLTALKPYLPVDEAIGAWARRTGHPIAYTAPSLVDHDDTLPTLTQHRDRAPRTPGRVAWKTGTRTVWTSESVTL